MMTISFYRTSHEGADSVREQKGTRRTGSSSLENGMPSRFTQSDENRMDLSFTIEESDKRSLAQEGKSGTAAASKLLGKLGGRLLVYTAALLLVILFATATIVGINANGTAPEPAGEGETTIVVTSGDTLWSIARGTGVSGDIRRAVFEIKERNGLEGSDLVPGQKLIVPKAEH